MTFPPGQNNPCGSDISRVSQEPTATRVFCPGKPYIIYGPQDVNILVNDQGVYIRPKKIGKRREYLRGWRKENSNKIKCTLAEYQIKHKEEISNKAKNKRLKIKIACLLVYSNTNIPQCSYKGCDVIDMDMLCIDHINGGGKAHRIEIGKNDIYRWLIKHMFPIGFQTLCMNHNFKKGIEGMRKENYNDGTYKVTYREQKKEERIKMKLECLSIYSTNNTPQCSYEGCTIVDTDMLCIDHINNDGKAHRKTIGHSNMYIWAVKTGFPSGYQTLCANHNLKKVIERKRNNT